MHLLAGVFSTRSLNDSDFYEGSSLENDIGPLDSSRLSSTGTILYTIFYAILCPAIVVCNMVVIAVFARMKRRNGQSVYKVSIAVSDLIFGIIVIPLIFVLMYTDAKTTILHIYLCIERTSIMVSVCTMLAMGFDRLYAVLRPRNYNSDKSRKTALIFAVVIWCVSSMIAISVDIVLPMTSMTQVDEEDLSGRWMKVVEYTVFLAIALLLVWMNNVAVYCVIKRKMNATNLGDNTSSTRLKRHRDTVITLWIMAGTFTVSAFPLVVYYIVLIQDISRLFYSGMQITGVLASICLVTNCVWYCFVYSFRQKEFRDKAKEIFLSCGHDICPRTEEEASTRHTTST